MNTGGFIPKGPGIIDEYFAIYPSTHSPAVPHLTTSMQLDITKGKYNYSIATYNVIFVSNSTIYLQPPVCNTVFKIKTLHCLFCDEKSQCFSRQPATKTNNQTIFINIFSMLLSGECITRDGRHVLEGDSISLACSICTCSWGELHCSPRPCHTPPGCSRRPASTSTVDLCCGELVCEQGMPFKTLYLVKKKH